MRSLARCWPYLVALAVVAVLGGSFAVAASAVDVWQRTQNANNYRVINLGAPLETTDATQVAGTGTPAAVASSGALGAAYKAARSDHAHAGVASLAKSGGSALTGAVTVSEGSGITITPSGNDLAFAASGAAGPNHLVGDTFVCDLGTSVTCSLDSAATPATTWTTIVAGVTVIVPSAVSHNVVVRYARSGGGVSAKIRVTLGGSTSTESTTTTSASYVNSSTVTVTPVSTGPQTMTVECYTSVASTCYVGGYIVWIT